ncbi:amino acid adenylation protein [Burkholderia multivorans]|uniref:amino acid adenylation domain-containing protein n=1 Tax=Burkholderia multivorans TaxID=87883 RepID=UPI000CFEED0E|nr:amino acid adenylation domain-containing protein [Burkholderia multivorans]PRG14833.1 amino acid adenylation protein [Burkholderia multivorans]
MGIETIESTVLHAFSARVAEAPNHTAILARDASLTYGELDARSNRVARALIARGVAPGSLVPVEAVRSADFLVALLGVLKAGAAYIPIDDAYPAERKRHIYEQSGATVALHARANAAAEPSSAGVAPLAVASLIGDDAPDGELRTPAPHDLLYVIFTSGTTGRPKGVEIEHHAVARLVDWHNREFGVTAASRMPLMAGLSFDISQWEIWSALTAGATLLLPDEEIRPDADALVAFHRDHATTHAFVPTVMVPDFVRASRGSDLALRYLFTAGEKLQPVDTDGATYTLIDFYGPTETTIFATMHRVPSATLGRPSSIGHPVPGATIHVLDAQLAPLPDGQVGELCIAGPCVARGYLNDPSLTHDKFVALPHDRSQRLYRTGDLGRRLPDGSIQYLGRMDDQLKIRGHRVELGEIASVLSTQPGIRKCAVIAVEDASNAKDIVAFVVPDAEHANGDVIGSIRTRIRACLPHYMRPRRYVVLPELPVTLNGKVDKAALRELDDGSAARASNAGWRDDRIDTAIARTLAPILGHTDFGPADNFFDIGGHSLLIAEFVRRLGETLRMKVYVRDVYECPTGAALRERLEARLNERQSLLDAEPARALRDDIALPDGIASFRPFDTRRLERPAHILLTGATGFVGVHLLADLLERTDAVVHCTVRAADGASARARIVEQAQRYRVALPDSSRWVAHAADLSLPRLGMSDADYRTLAGCVDVIYHSASAVNFIQPYSYMRTDNVDGLKRVLAFAADGQPKALMLLSTISVYSWGHLHTGKTTVSEDDDIDQNLPAVMTDIGYVRSKWVMEKVADLAASRGLPLMTFRLGYATFHRDTGLSANYQWWGRLVRTCIDQQQIPDLRNLREGLTTVDYMTRAIAHISRNPSALGHKYNLVHTDDNNLTLRQFFERLERHFGLRFETVPFRQWLDGWQHDTAAPLYPLLSLFRDVMYDGRSTVELYQDTYRWRCDRVRAALQGSGIEEPTFTRDELARYLTQSIGHRV